MNGQGRAGDKAEAEKRPSYQAYLLRCWREGKPRRGGVRAWRFSLQEVGGEGRRWGFGDFDALVAFLRTATVQEGREEAKRNT